MPGGGIGGLGKFIYVGKLLGYDMYPSICDGGDYY